MHAICSSFINYLPFFFNTTSHWACVIRNSACEFIISLMIVSNEKTFYKIIYMKKQNGRDR